MQSSNIVNYGPPIPSNTVEDHDAVASWLLWKKTVYSRDTVKSIILGQNFVYTEPEFQKVLEMKIWEVQHKGWIIDIKVIKTRINSLRITKKANTIRIMIEEIMANNSTQKDVSMTPISV